MQRKRKKRERRDLEEDDGAVVANETAVALGVHVCRRVQMDG